MTKMVDRMTTDMDLSVFHDCFKERIETLIKSKMKGVKKSNGATRAVRRPWTEKDSLMSYPAIIQ